MRSFDSDNNASVHPSIMKAIIDANIDHATGYGNDPWTDRAAECVRSMFTPDCEPLFVFNGTGSNVMALGLLTRPYSNIICTEQAHIITAECGAPSLITGCMIRPIDTTDGKLTPELIRPLLKGIGDEHRTQPGAIYISQSTELGTSYTPNEIRAITTLAHAHGVLVHMDGARIANVAAAMGLTIKEISQDCGVDTLTLGGTKNGLMIGECVVVFNDALKSEAKYYRKQAAQLASKMRYISCQFIPYIADNIWLTCAEAANSKALKLYNEIKELPNLHFTQPMQSNQLFFSIPQDVIDSLSNRFIFHVWNPETQEVRIVTSWDTSDRDIDDFAKALKLLLQ